MSGPSLFWWSEKKKDELLKFWENYILIMETLEGNQVSVFIFYQIMYRCSFFSSPKHFIEPIQKGLPGYSIMEYKRTLFSSVSEWVKSLSCVWLSTTLWAIACQAPLSVGFFRQEYWSGLPFPSPGDLPDPGVELRSPTLQALFTI